MEAGYDLSPEMRTWVSPSLIEANYILSLSRLELQAVIAAEMDANPALDVDERPVCPLCGNVLEGTFCPICLVSQRRDADPENYEDFPEILALAHSTREDGDDFDPLSLVAQGDDVREQILLDARTLLSEDEYPIAEYLVDALDERGLITCDLDELRESDRQDPGRNRRDRRSYPGCRPRRRRRALASGKPLAPDRLFAFDRSRHSLAGRADRRKIICREFGAHKFGQLSKELGLKPEEIEEAREFIRTHLNPFPVASPQQPIVADADLLRLCRARCDHFAARRELRVEIVDTREFHLRLSPMYGLLSAELGRRKAVDRNANGHAEHAAILRRN